MRRESHPLSLHYLACVCSLFPRLPVAITVRITARLPMGWLSLSEPSYHLQPDWSFWEGSRLASNAPLPCILPSPSDVGSFLRNVPGLNALFGLLTGWSPSTTERPRFRRLDYPYLITCPTVWTRYLAQRSI